MPPSQESHASERAKTRGLAKLLMRDYEVQYAFRMPGQILEAEGMKMSGRDATVSWDIDDIFDMLEDPESLEEGFTFVVTSAPGEDITGEMADFRKEMAEIAPQERKGRFY